MTVQQTAESSAARAAAAPLLSSSARHFARRFSGGITPTLTKQIRAAGSGQDWFEQQLRPSRVSDTPGARVDSWFPSLRRTPLQLYKRNEAGTQGVWEVMSDLSRWTVARRIYSNRQLLEQMVDFWSNLLHVPLYKDDAEFWRVDYDRTIRANALGSFENLLLACETHPAMGLFLDNATSSKPEPNENLGRELLELHTVGIDGGYTEADVKMSAKILTGYRVDVWWPSFRSFYDKKSHWTGRVTVMGFSDANSSSDGRATTAKYLKYLANHPATAKRLARRLCVRFVSDNPSDGLVNTVARAYLRHGTAIKPTLRAMVNHPEFLGSRGVKVRTPMEDYIATVRALRIQMKAPTSDNSFARAFYWQYSELGQAPYEWPAPDGYPDAGAAWMSTGRLLTSFSNHRNLTARWWPTQRATFAPESTWLPPLPATVESVIVYAGRALLGETPNTAVVAGIASVIGMAPNHKLTSAESKDYWAVKAIVSSLLDSPAHLHR